MSDEEIESPKEFLESEDDASASAFDAHETYAAQAQALRQIWDDPRLDIYDDLDSRA
jgi:hypothetical protein